MTYAAPISDVPAPVSRKGIWSWMLFDWAAQPFHTLIITFVFAPYFAGQVAADGVAGQSAWASAATVGGILIALLSPVLGAVSDATGPRKPWIFGFSVLAVVGSASLWFVTPDADPANIRFALVAFVVALIGFEFAAIFNNAMMPGLVTRERLGALSGNAWALGYAGGLVCLIFMLVFLVANPQTGLTLVGLAPAFGLDPAQLEGDRASGIITAAWFAVFVVPLFLFTPDAGRRAAVGNAVRQGLSDLWTTIRTLPQQRSLFAFLGSSMFYRDALNGLYTFGGIYAVGVLGWSTVQLGVFGILASITGIAGCIAGGALDHRIGTKTVVTVSILVLLVASAMVVSTSDTGVLGMAVAPGSGLPDIIFYCAGALIGAAGGALQAASRPLLVDQVAEPERMGEAFGLYALSGRATAFLAPAGIWLFTELSGSQRIGILPVLILFAIGLALLPFVKTRR